MSLKLHYLHSHLKFFWPNLGALPEEYGEWFHQDLHLMEKWYGMRAELMMVDYVWTLVLEDGLTRRDNDNLMFTFEFINVLCNYSFAALHFVCLLYNILLLLLLCNSLHIYWITKINIVFSIFYVSVSWCWKTNVLCIMHVKIDRKT